MLTPKDYDLFCLADPDFYELPERCPDDHDRLPATRRALPRGWDRGQSGWWVTMRPRETALPAQGWQIHVSVRLPEVTRAVDIVWGHCTAHGLAFDFVRSHTAARALCAEDADRRTGGRLATVHAGDETALGRCLAALAPLLDGLTGPYAHGALRYGAGPLYVRYGSSGGRLCPDGEGDWAPALQRPDGRLVPEPRRPVFTVPDWLDLPQVLRPALEALHARPAGEFPYRVERALGQNHGGGTYLAADRHTGARVVLREARPHAGLDRRGEDAVARLGRRRDMLERLAGLSCVPRLIGHRPYGEHHFLAEEYIEGTPLAHAAADAFPLTSEHRAAAEAGPYARWALDIADQLAAALADLQARGVRLTGLDPRHVLLRPDGRIALTGLARAAHSSDTGPDPFGPSDFTVPADRQGADATAYLLDRLRLWLLMPLPFRHPAKLHTLTAAVQRHYPLPGGFGANLLTRLWPAGHRAEADTAGELLAAERPDWPALRDSLVRGIHATATPGREDRLFPGSPTGRTAIGGYPFGRGAAGVLYALHRVGADVPSSYAAWLVAAVRRERRPLPGLYDGLHGVALTLELLGHRAEALEVLDRCRAVDEHPATADLASGTAGVALNLLHFATVTADTALHDRALRHATALGHLVEDGPLPALRGRPAPHGLLHGPTGIALLFLRLYEETGQARWLGLADTALQQDLARLRTLPDGTVTLSGGSGELPYLHGGSTGLVPVLRDLLAHRPDPGRAALLTALGRTCDPVYVHNAGLLRGRAGAIAMLAALGGTDDHPAVRRQVRRLSWHARHHRGHLAFPGFRLLRLSSDLATGSAGVLLALSSACEGSGPVLPFLAPRSVTVAPRKGGDRHGGDPGTAGAGRGGDARSVAV